MSNEEFIKEIKKIVVGEKNAHKAVRKLTTIGFRLVEGGKNGVSHLTHERIGNHKVSIGTLRYEAKWGLNFITQIRHAMWKVAA